MAPHTSILAWRNPLTEGPGGLWFIGSRAGLGMHTCAYYHLCHDTKFHCFRACLVALVKQVCEPILGVYVRTWKTLKWLQFRDTGKLESGFASNGQKFTTPLTHPTLYEHHWSKSKALDEPHFLNEEPCRKRINIPALGQLLLFLNSLSSTRPAPRSTGKQGRVLQPGDFQSLECIRITRASTGYHPGDSQSGLWCLENCISHQEGGC